jgi:hypothetical protein
VNDMSEVATCVENRDYNANTVFESKLIRRLWGYKTSSREMVLDDI